MVFQTYCKEDSSHISNFFSNDHPLSMILRYKVIQHSSCKITLKIISMGSNDLKLGQIVLNVGYIWFSTYLVCSILVILVKNCEVIKRTSPLISSHFTYFYETIQLLKIESCISPNLLGHINAFKTCLHFNSLRHKIQCSIAKSDFLY